MKRIKIEDLKVSDSKVKSVSKKQAKKICGGIRGGDPSWPSKPP